MELKLSFVVHIAGKLVYHGQFFSLALTYRIKCFILFYLIEKSRFNIFRANIYVYQWSSQYQSQ